jgi:hypothetical protein
MKGLDDRPLRRCVVGAGHVPAGTVLGAGRLASEVDELATPGEEVCAAKAQAEG